MSKTPTSKEYMVFSKSDRLLEHLLALSILSGNDIIGEVDHHNLWSTHPIFIVIPTNTSCYIE